MSSASPILTPRQLSFRKYWALSQHEMIYLCWGAMDAALLTPFALSLMGWARYWPPWSLFLSCLLIMGLAFNLARLMSTLRLKPSLQQTVMALTLALLIFISMRSLLYNPTSLIDMGWVTTFFQYLNERGNLLWQRDIVLFFLIILVWARGIQMAGRTYSVDRIGLRLRLGGLVIAPFVIWIGSRNLLWDVTPFVFLFFLAGLIAIALTRAEEISIDETGFSASLTPRWLTFVLGAAVLIIFVGGLITLLISDETATAVFGLLSPFWLAVESTIITVVATIGFLLEPLIQFLEIAVAGILWFWQWITLFFILITKILSKYFFRDWTPELTEVEVEPTGINIGPQLFDQIEKLPYGIGQSGQLITILLAVAVILIVALLLQRRYAATLVKGVIGERYQGGPEDQPDDANLLQKILGRLGRWRNWRTAVSIRRIYRQMLMTAAAAGYPKPAAETPYEYRQTLAVVWPEHHADLDLITTAYVNVRYGQIPETKAELAELKQAWQRLEVARPEKKEENLTTKSR